VAYFLWAMKCIGCVITPVNWGGIGHK